MKYINPVNFILAIAALAFSVYVFSMTFMSSSPVAELAAEVPQGAPNQGLSKIDATDPGGQEPASKAEPTSTPGAAQPEFTGQQPPPQDRRSVAPSNPRSPFRPPANRTRPPVRTNRLDPGSPDSPPGVGMPAGAIIPEDTPPRPPRKSTSPPPTAGSVQDRRPLPLRDRGDIKREPDPDAPPPTRGSRQ